jgi:ribosomal protein L29
MEHEPPAQALENQQQPLLEDGQMQHLHHGQLLQQQPGPDEVRQMPDAVQQLLRELSQKQDQMFHQLQKGNNNKTIPLSIFLSTIVIIAVAFLFRSPLAFVSQNEFETFKTENQKQLVSLNENYKTSISAFESRLVLAEKPWEEIIVNLTKMQTPAELPDLRLEQLVGDEIAKHIKSLKAEITQIKAQHQAEVSNMRNDINELKKAVSRLETEARKLTRSFNLLNATKQEPKQAHTFTAGIVSLVILAVLL